MLGISEENVVEHVEGERRVPQYDDEDAVTMVYNHTDPLVISDGVDSVTVVEEADGLYLVDYWGYLSGYLRVEREGVAELGESLLGGRSDVPDWLLVSPIEAEDLPWWIPDAFDRTLHVAPIPFGTHVWSAGKPAIKNRLR